MKAGHFHRVISQKLFDSFPQRLPDAMTQFDMVEAERENLAQHLVAASVTAGIPAGGESEHSWQEFRSCSRSGVRIQEPGVQELQEEKIELFVALKMEYQPEAEEPLPHSVTPELLNSCPNHPLAQVISLNS
jgi:hypothetical protein